MSTGTIYPLGDGIGSVELLEHMGNDLTVVNAARVSYAKESLELANRDKKLIRFLMRERHGSPFEHAVFTFRVKAPLFVVRQWQRHRIASYNEQSGRWTEFEPEFYCPSAAFKHHSEVSFERYQGLLINGVTKEQARMILPQNLYTSFWFTVNARSLMNFLMVRNEEHAQFEIRQYAEALERFFAITMPSTFAAFIENGRVAP